MTSDRLNQLINILASVTLFEMMVTIGLGVTVAEMARGRSDNFRRNFLGIHLFNPPHVIVGTEVIPHAETDPKLVPEIVRLLETRFGRTAIVTDDKPAFCGNRVGFRVLNECAQLAEKHGAAYIDALVGPHTGRAMAPMLGEIWDRWQSLVSLRAHQGRVDQAIKTRNCRPGAATGGRNCASPGDVPRALSVTQVSPCPPGLRVGEYGLLCKLTASALFFDAAGFQQGQKPWARGKASRRKCLTTAAPPGVRGNRRGEQ